MKRKAVRVRWSRIALAHAVAVALLVPLAGAAAPLESTFLLDVRQGSARSDVAARLARGGYELADGTAVNFADWYSPRWPDIHVEFLTQIHRNAGVIWGFSTGERGAKYRIAPGLKLGFVISVNPSRNSKLSLTATAQLGSELREKSCLADFGDIGGVQRVNCRLAASPLEPAKTLQYNLKMSGLDDSRIALLYEFRF